MDYRQMAAFYGPGTDHEVARPWANGVKWLTAVSK
jgi:hypothetical protein